jgi:hypothetical protein
MTSDRDIVGQLFRELREKLGEDYKTFANHFGLEAEDIQRMESGDAVPDSDAWKRLTSLCYEFLPGRLLGPGMSCSECGSPVEYFEKGLSSGLECAVCGHCNGVWTNANHPRYDAKALYDVQVDRYGLDRKTAIVTLAVEFGLDIHLARRIIDKKNAFAEQVSAEEVKSLHDRLTSVGMDVLVTPEFPWDFSTDF